jgi:hypothetical protein
MRQHAAPKIEFEFVTANGGKPTSTFADLGSEMVTGPPVYEAGDFVVLDTVKDCQWTVCQVMNDGPPHSVRALRQTTDKYEAIRWCDEFREVQES